MSDEDIENLSRPDLIELARSLMSELNERDEQISELSRQIESNRGRGGNSRRNSDNGIDSVLKDIEELRINLEESDKQNEKLKSDLSALTVRFTDVKSERDSYEQQTKGLNKKIEALEKEIIEQRGKLTADDKNKAETENETKKRRDELVKALRDCQQYADENSKLKDEKRVLEDQIEKLGNALTELNEDNLELEAFKNNVDLKINEMEEKIADLTRELQNDQRKLQAAEDDQTRYENEAKSLRIQFESVNKEAEKERNKLLSEIESLRLQVTSLKDSTQIGKKQLEIDTLQNRVLTLEETLIELRNTNDELVEDNSTLTKELDKYKLNFDRTVKNQIDKERERIKELEASIRDRNITIHNLQENLNETNETNKTLINERDELLHWKSIYEAGHGSQELAKRAKKLNDDNRRLKELLDRISEKNGELTDNNALLSQAIEEFIGRSGGEDKGLDHERLRRAMNGDNARLRSQLQECQRLLETTEQENISLRRTLLERAGDLGDKNYADKGLNQDQVIQVKQFIDHLKKGGNDNGNLNFGPNEIIANLKTRLNQLEQEKELLLSELMQGRSRNRVNFREPLDDNSSNNNGHDDLDDGYDMDLPVHSIADRNRQQQLRNTSKRYDNLDNDTSDRDMNQSSKFTHDNGNDGHNGNNNAPNPDIIPLHNDIQRLLQENGELGRVLDSTRNELAALRGDINRNTLGDNARRMENEALRLAREKEMLLQRNYQLEIQLNELKKVKDNNNNNDHKAQDGDRNPNQDMSMLITVNNNINNNNNNNNNHNIRGAFQLQLPSTVKKAPNNPALNASTIGRAGLNITTGPQSPTPRNQGGMGDTVLFSTRKPTTPHGKIIFQQTLQKNEESSDFIKELQAQLIESLEQLQAKEEECEKSNEMLTQLQDHLVSLKQQMCALYLDHFQKCKGFEAHEKEFVTERSKAKEENEDLRKKVEHLTKILDSVRNDSEESVRLKYEDLARKMTKYEVNETVLSRKFISLTEMLEQSQNSKLELQKDFVEMESTLKQRILYLEQYKSFASNEISVLQAQAQVSVTREDFMEVKTELDALRETHLSLLENDVHLRHALLQKNECIQKVKYLEYENKLLKSDLDKERLQVVAAYKQLEHEKFLSQQALLAVKNSHEVGTLITQVANFRGEASRLDTEHSILKAKFENLQRSLIDNMKENDALRVNLLEIQEKELDANRREGEMKKEVLDMKLKYDNGLTSTDAQLLNKRIANLSNECEELRRDVNRYKELAEIAANQSQSIQHFSQSWNDEINNLREQLSSYESRSDDDVLIGRYQRLYMSTKTSLKTFVRKYEILRNNMRQRELAIRILENRLQSKEESSIKYAEVARAQIHALKKVVRGVLDMVDHQQHGSNINGTINNQTDILSLDIDKLCERSELNSLKSLFEPVKQYKKLGYMTVGKKLMDISDNMGKLTKLMDSSLKRTLDAEAKVKTLKESSEALTSEKESLIQQVMNLKFLVKDSNKAVIAEKIVSLSDEIKAQKLVTLSQKREIQNLRHEKKALETAINRMKGEFHNLDELQVAHETKDLLRDVSSEAHVTNNDQSNKHTGAGFTRNKRFLNAGNDVVVNLDETIDEGRPNEESTKSKRMQGAGTSGKVKFDIEVSKEDQINHEAMMERLEATMKSLNEARRDAHEYKSKLDMYMSKVADLETRLEERAGGANALYPPPTQQARLGFPREETEKLQQVANITIQSLKGLISDKNEQIEKLQYKIEELNSRGYSSNNYHGNNPRSSEADRRAESLLRSLDQDSMPNTSRSNRDMQKAEAEIKALEQKLIDQIESSDGLMNEKVRMISQLEEKLSFQLNLRETAEKRCGEFIYEMNAMKADMITLVKQLQGAEEQLRNFSGLPSPSKRTQFASSFMETHHEEKKDDSEHGENNDSVSKERFHALDTELKESKRQVKIRDKRMMEYRNVIIRLKDEFLKSENEKAIAILHAENKAARNGIAPLSATNGADSTALISSKEIHELRNQIHILKDGLVRAKEDLEKSKSNHQKLLKSRQDALDDKEKLESELNKFISKASDLQEKLEITKREIEERKRSEMKLRDMIRQLQSERNPTSEHNSKTEMKVEELQRHNEILQTQNVALRRALESGNDPNIPFPMSTAGIAGAGQGATMTSTSIATNNNNTTTNTSNTNNRTNVPSSPMSARGPGDTRGQVLGTSGDIKGDLQQQLHAKWENEKKMQKRLSLLESRLQEKSHAVEELNETCQRLRQQVLNLQQAASTKANKSGGGGTASGPSGGSNTTRDDNQSGALLEQTRSRLFSLEEENTALRRKVEVDHVKEVSFLRHQMAQLREKLNESESELQQRQESSSKARLDGDFLSETLIREESLKEEVAQLKRHRIQLEASLIERDSQNFEMRFEIENSQNEILRLRRRVDEMQEALDAARRNAHVSDELTGMHSVRSNAMEGFPTTTTTGQARTKKEKELEAVVDAVKKVADKLKADNDKLKADNEKLKRSTSTTGGDPSKDFEKKYTMEKRRNEKLEDDLKKLELKAKTFEEVNLKMVQKQQQLAQIQKKVKAKEDEFAVMKSQFDTMKSEKDLVQEKLALSESRIAQLEVTVQQLKSSSGGTTSNSSNNTLETMELKRRNNEIIAEMNDLKRQLNESKRIIERLQAHSDGNQSNSNNNNSLEVKRLREENEKLKSELSAFDLEFFEEIENLKFAHAEAIKKLKQYENNRMY